MSEMWSRIRGMASMILAAISVCVWGATTVAPMESLWWLVAINGAIVICLLINVGIHVWQVEYDGAIPKRETVLRYGRWALDALLIAGMAYIVVWGAAS
jgi:hypothetical protein